MNRVAKTILRKTAESPRMISFLVLLCVVVATHAAKDEDGSRYLIGTGIYDITGPAAQVPFMGYAKSFQQGRGIHLRLRSRAFLMAKPAPTSDSVAEEATKEAIHSVQKVERLKVRSREEKEVPPPKTFVRADPQQTVCFVSADIGMGSDLLTLKVVQRLEEILPKEPPGKRLCHLENLSISGTHTHSAPGGFLQYVLYQINTFGYSDETMDTYVEGIAQSILRAYNNLQEGSMTVAEDMLFGSNINRSPTSYLLNPQEERDQYASEGDTDKRMLQLQFTAKQDKKEIGVLNWFAVHGTSMNYSNQLISGDNKGYASFLLEEHQNGNETMPGKGDFVAAFASTNLGDVSPNTNGAVCVDTGLPCDLTTSSCNGRTQLCRASGPGRDMFESTEIIGRKQFELALKVLKNKEKKEKLDGPVSFRHSFLDMANTTVKLVDGRAARTCSAALGYGFGGGTTDGPGDFDFTQGTNSSNPFWNMISSFLSRPSKEQIQCHHPKPILLNTGEVIEPYRWDPNSIPISVFRVGRLFILNVPSEFTTMAGRRLRNAIRQTASAMGVEDPLVTIAGLSNSYTHYVATIEEYEGQRYEAASTLFGPHTLSAYIQEFKRITKNLLDSVPSSTVDPPIDLSDKQISLIPPVVVDPIEVGREFGSVVNGPKRKYTAGEDTATVVFRSANPRNNQRIEGTYLTVERWSSGAGWQSAYVDGHWCTKITWRVDPFWDFIFAEVSWKLPVEAMSGRYRICHFGAAKKLVNTFEAPEWMTTVLGSTFASHIESGVGFIASLPSKLQGRVALTERHHIAEFSGCTRPFFVEG